MAPTRKKSSPGALEGLNALDYEDYRLFLKAAYDQLKSKRGRYSYREFSKDVGFNSSNYLHLVVGGKRNLSREGADQVSKFFSFSPKQKRYFLALVDYNQNTVPSEKQEKLDELQRIRGQKRKVIGSDSDNYFSTWYLPVIREIITLKGFVSNLNWIARKLKPRITEEAARTALNTLERLGLLRHEKGRWQQVEEHLTTPLEVTSSTVHRYHREMIKLSSEALDHEPHQRDISAMTLSLSPTQFVWIKQRLAEFREELQEHLQKNPDDPTVIGQLNMQLFKLTDD